MIEKSIALRKKRSVLSEGFTLLEVLVSLSIISVGIAAAAKMITQSVTVRDETEKRFIANLVSSNHLNSLLASPNWRRAINGRSENMAGYEWKVKTEYSATPNADIIRIDVSLSGDLAGDYGQFFYYKANLNQRVPGR